MYLYKILVQSTCKNCAFQLEKGYKLVRALGSSKTYCLSNAPVTLGQKQRNPQMSFTLDLELI